MSCPTNCVSASWPCTWLTRNASLMCILLKSPVRSCTVTSVIRPTSLPGSSVGVSPRACLLNISGARRLYHTFAFHLSLILRAAARDFFSAMRAVRKGEAYLRVLGRTDIWRWLHSMPTSREQNSRGRCDRQHGDEPEDGCHPAEERDAGGRSDPNLDRPGGGLPQVIGHGEAHRVRPRRAKSVVHRGIARGGSISEIPTDVVRREAA